MRKMKKEPMSDRYNIKGAERCFQILDLAIKLDRSISISDVMQKFDVNTNMKSTCRRRFISSSFSSLVIGVMMGGTIPLMKSVFIPPSYLPIFVPETFA